jgi:hypothetical protein
LVATKGAKPQKTNSTVPKAKVPSTAAKSRRWPKDASAVTPIQSETPEVTAANDAAYTAGEEERSPRSGLTKSELKAQFAKLSAATAQIGSLKRTLNKSFVEVGSLLHQIRGERLYEVKGYGSFESFVEREIDINKSVCAKLVRIAETLHREPALAAGLERASAAVAALDGETEASQAGRPGGSPAGGVPLHKQ